jgi:FKBP-type peptidyl-prolyl cis-trans isomerase SlyD
MADKVKEGDFIEVEYTGRFKDGTVFDTTDEELAKEKKIYSPRMKYGSNIICVGQGQLVEGLDEALVDKEIGKGYVVELTPEKAFGKKDFKKIMLVSHSEFKKQNLNPQPGLQVEIDGQVGTVIRSSGGRVMVNFNHPFAGKEVNYEIKINKKIEDKATKVKSYLELTLNMPKVEVEMKEDKAVVTLPMKMGEDIEKLFAGKIKAVTGVETEFAEKTTAKQ